MLSNDTRIHCLIIKKHRNQNNNKNKNYLQDVDTEIITYHWACVTFNEQFLLAFIFFTVSYTFFVALFNVDSIFAYVQ